MCEMRPRCAAQERLQTLQIFCGDGDGDDDDDDDCGCLHFSRCVKCRISIH